jgi:hypothetical protein
MDAQLIPLLSILILLVALIYASVGHGGASGYIAVMALFGLAPAALKPTALLLNIVVSAVAAWLFWRAGQFSWRGFWPFALTSIPASFIGGCFTLPPHVYRPLLGLALLFAAFRLVFRRERPEKEIRPPQMGIALGCGALLGLVSGLIGVGGGIFLSPLMVLLGWARVREVSGIAALFILVNSAAGLLGHLSSLQQVPAYAPLLGAAALCGGTVGSLLGSRHFPVAVVVRALALVLVLAGGKLILL